MDVEEIVYSSKTATIYMTVEWDNSWRDNQNWDAVYVFLKSKRVTDIAWSHVMLRDKFHVISPGYDYFMAKNPAGSADNSIGMFIYRNKKGSGTSKVQLELQWNFGAQGLVRADFVNGLQYEAFAIEMVYIPKGPFRPGDLASNNTFKKRTRQILPDWDLVKPETIMTKDWMNSDPAAFDPNFEYNGPTVVCNKDNSPGTLYWISVETKSALESPYIRLDLGSEKVIKYVALELVNEDVVSWDLIGLVKNGTRYSQSPLATFQNTQRGLGSPQTYPIVTAYPVLTGSSNQLNTKAFRYYQIQFNMVTNGRRAQVRSLSMTDKDLSNYTEDSYVIDGPATTFSFGTGWNSFSVNGKDYSGSLGNIANRIVHYAVGFEGYYAMKYEISQRQYVDFLNKLTSDEQRLRTIGDALDELSMGDYVYGASHKTPSCRNGIVVGAMQDNRFAFACNLNPNNLYNQSDDGESVACNYLSPKDMLAYASWSGLRPMSELEYEKMARQTVDSASGIVPYYTLNSYAWGNTTLKLPANSTISSNGMATEKLAAANVNTGNKVQGPVRSGSFSASTDASAVNSGASYYGVMELSGNLAEIYYRAEPNKVLLSQEFASHGNGALSAGEMHTNLNAYWCGNQANTDLFASSLILRGGHFRSESNRARLGDREEYSSYSLAGLNRKDSTATFRLGYSLTYNQGGNAEYYPVTWLQAQNGQKAAGGATVYDTICMGTNDFTSYKITGSDPRTEGMVATGELRYVWYSTPGNGIWTMMEGKNGKDLTVTKAELDHYSATLRTYSFKRRIYTPTQYSESGVVSLKVGTNRPFTRDKDEVLNKSNHVKGVLVESIVPATFTWSWSANTNGTNAKPLPAFYTTANSSYMSLHRDTFPTSVPKGRLICLVRTNELGCVKEVSVPLTVEARPTTGMASNAMTITTCGQAVKDARDDQIYTTVKIGTQCWMAENMRYKGTNNRVGNQAIYFPPADPKGTVLGVLYYNYNTWTSICPEGWVLPSNNDFSNLLYLANNYGGDAFGRFRLRAGNFWLVARTDRNYYTTYIYAKPWNHESNPTTYESGFNTLGFGLMGSTYHTYNPPTNPSYNYAFLLTRSPYSGYWMSAWHMHYLNHEFQLWNNAGYYLPARCILQSTSAN